jgi:fumarate reductase flavoprotein subunit
LGSNSLTELLVFGARAARAAVRFGAQAGDVAVEEIIALAEQEQGRIRERFFQPKGGTETIAGLRVELTHAMESGAGIYRSEESLRESCDKIRELKQRFNQIELADHSLTFNTELTTALELEYMLDISEAFVHSALARTESRGSHQRTDYPQRDDQRFLKHSLAYRSDGDPRIEYLDVVITRWPPGERIYGSK